MLVFNIGYVYLQDLAENGIEIELMHIGSSFDVPAFYQVMLTSLILSNK